MLDPTHLTKLANPKPAGLGRPYGGDQPPATSDPASAGEASWPITGKQATVWATVWATGWATGWECPMLTPSGVSGHVAGSDLEG